MVYCTELVGVLSFLADGLIVVAMLTLVCLKEQLEMKHAAVHSYREKVVSKRKPNFCLTR